MQPDARPEPGAPGPAGTPALRGAPHCRSTIWDQTSGRFPGDGRIDCPRPRQGLDVPERQFLAALAASALIALVGVGLALLIRDKDAAATIRRLAPEPSDIGRLPKLAEAHVPVSTER